MRVELKRGKWKVKEKKMKLWDLWKFFKN